MDAHVRHIKRDTIDTLASSSLEVAIATSSEVTRNTTKQNTNVE
jgi:hypothetical protein